MSKDDVNPPAPPVVDGATEQAENAPTLAKQMIRKLDEQSNKKLEQISADEKTSEPELRGEKQKQEEEGKGKTRVA